MTKSNPPVKKFKVGKIHVSIWKNDGPRGSLYAVDFERRYKDGEVWKSSRSYLIEQLEDVIAAAQMAMSYAPLLKRMDKQEAE